MHFKRFTAFSFALLLVLGAALLAAPAPSLAQAACGTIHTTDMATWDMYTGVLGHYELVDGGVHVWTDQDGTPPTYEDVVQASWPLVGTMDIPFSTITSASINYTTIQGTIPPGIFIFLDTDGDGDWNGAIIGETVYGANWWLSNGSKPDMKAGAPHTGGGNGSNWFGTLAEWSTAFPNAQVLWVGFSLGSGVFGEGVVHSMTFGCHVFTFGLPFEGFTCRVMVDGPMTGPLYAEKLLGREWADWNGFVVQDLDKHGGIEISLHHHAGESNTWTYYRVIGANGGEIRYFSTTDQPGICAEVSDPLADNSH